MPSVRVARFDELDSTTIYGILRLRAEVFVVEQACAYADVDGRDLEHGARHVWIEEGGRVLSYLRLLDDGDAHRIGRVVTVASRRGEGLGRQVMVTALALIDGPVVLDAQAHLVQWYSELGFDVAGPQFVEDGIPHVPMRLDR